jgi:predicted transcriptional regulator
VSDSSRYVAGHRLPGAEADVLETLLDADGPLTVSELQAALPGARAHTTVATLLSRLADRGLVARRTRERVYEWHPVADRDGLTVAALRAVVDHLDEPGPAVIGFLEELTKRKGRGSRST